MMDHWCFSPVSRSFLLVYVSQRQSTTVLMGSCPLHAQLISESAWKGREEGVCVCVSGGGGGDS